MAYITQDAPKDGKRYGRRNGAWVRVQRVKPLDLCTPAEIKEAIQAGYAPDWYVGDLTAPIVLNGTVGALKFDNLSVRAFILGIDHNKDLESGGNPNVHFGFAIDEDNIDVAFCDSQYGSYGETAGFRMNKKSTTSGGWKGSYMKTVCLEFLAALPEEWQAIIASCTKYTDNTGNKSNTAAAVTVTSDKIFLLSEFEVKGKRTYANQYEKNKQQQYDYYKNGGNKIKHKHDDPAITVWWWLRSARFDSNIYFCGVHSNSDVAFGNVSYTSGGFAPGFMVA